MTKPVTKYQTVNLKDFLKGDRSTNPTLTLESKSYIKINIFLMTVIAILLLTSEYIVRPVEVSEKSLLKEKI